MCHWQARRGASVGPAMESKLEPVAARWTCGIIQEGAMRRLISSLSGLCVVAALSAYPARGPAAFAAGARICRAPRSTATLALSYGTVHFANSCLASSQSPLNTAIAKLHSFEAEPRDFTSITRHDPKCAIAWWGAAMAARGNPLGGFLDASGIAQGRGFIEHARLAANATPREKGLIEALAVYYGSFPDNITRARAYSDRMDAVHAAYPDDADIAALDGLGIIEGVDLDDRTYARQKRAGTILEAAMKAHPENPGAPHYLIHAYDYAALAPMAVHAAEVYPTLATASSHAQHMPSHIWSVLGAWDKSIDANRRSEYVAEPASAHDPIAGDIVFEHAFDFIAYARLQKGEDLHVARDLAASRAKGEGMPLVVVARYALERDDWKDAAKAPLPNDVFDAVLARFTRGYGAARAGDVNQAETELASLRALRGPIEQAAGEYWAQSDDIYAAAIEAWILKAQGRDADALARMHDVAARDDGHGKHIYLENKLLPMRESLGDMELALGHPRDALAAYTASLALAPNRYRSFLGAAWAADAAGDTAIARTWWTKVMDLSKDGDKTRPGFAAAKARFTTNG